jgi:GAF domain-containing protein
VYPTSVDEDEMCLVLGAYMKDVHGASDAETAFRLADKAAAKLIGHQLFTIMAFHQEAMEVERCYSSNPDKYPTGGRKQKRNTAWGHHVLEQGRHFIGYNADDIRDNFDDHAVIEELGLESVLNVPIAHDGVTIGTMNILDVADYYSEDHVDIAVAIASALADVLRKRK